MTTFVQAAKQTLRDTFKYSGRISRSEYWWSVLFFYLELIILWIILTVFYGDYNAYNMPAFGKFLMYFTFTFCFAMYIPLISATVRRLHDCGHSGWYYFISLIPIVGGIIVCVKLFSKGEVGDNQYGHNPG